MYDVFTLCVSIGQAPLSRDLAVAAILTARLRPGTVAGAMKRKPSKPTDRIAVRWKRSSGSSQGVTVERYVRGHLYSRQVGPKGLLSPPEAAVALGVTREFVYQLVWDEKLKVVRREGRIAIPVSAVSAYKRNRSRRQGARHS